MKKLCALLALIWVTTLGASDPGPAWGSWQAHVWNTYCELKKEYFIPFRDDPISKDPSKRGFLSGTAFDRASLRFTANTQLQGESLGVIRFALEVYPEDLRPTSERITAANLGGYRGEAKMESEIQTFLLNAEESMQLLQRFTDSEIVAFELKFANGDTRLFKIYPSGDRTFYVWANMFQTCIKTHKGKTRRPHE